MSSFVRRIQRTQVGTDFSYSQDNGVGRYTHAPARGVHYQGRGSKLGVKNPKDAALLARLIREKARSSAHG